MLCPQCLSQDSFHDLRPCEQNPLYRPSRHERKPEARP